MIKIEITDPHLVPKSMLIDTATFLMKIAGIELLPKESPPNNISPPPGLVMPPFTGSADNAQLPTLMTCSTDIPSVPVAVDHPQAAKAPNRRTAKLEKEIGKLTEEVKDTRKLSPEGIVPPPPPMPRPLSPNPATVFAKPAPVVDDAVPRPIRIDVPRDTNGIPWDARIHIKSKAKNPNGTWKIRRDIDLKIVEEISQQIKLTLVGAPPPPRDKTKTTFQQVASGEPIERPLDWGGLMLKITSMVQAGKLTQKQVAEAVQSVGIPSLPVLPTRPDLIPQVALLIDSYN
jgi:hypothetical protein